MENPIIYNVCSNSRGILTVIKKFISAVSHTVITHFNRLILNRFLHPMTQTLTATTPNVSYFEAKHHSKDYSYIILYYIISGWCQQLHPESTGFASVNARHLFIPAAPCHIVFPCGPTLPLYTWLKEELSILWVVMPIKINMQKHVCIIYQVGFRTVFDEGVEQDIYSAINLLVSQYILWKVVKSQAPGLLLFRIKEKCQKIQLQYQRKLNSFLKTQACFEYNL